MDDSFPAAQGVRRASTVPLVWHDEDDEHQPLRSSAVNTRVREQASAPGSERPSAEHYGSSEAVGVEGVRLMRRPLTVETIWSCEVDTPVPPDFSIALELTNGMTLVIQHTWKTVDGKWFLVAKDGANRRMLVARFNRHRDLGIRHNILRTLGSGFAGDVSSLMVLLIGMCLAIGMDSSGSFDAIGADASSARGQGAAANGGGLRGLFFLNRIIGPNSRTIQDATFGLLAALLGVPPGDVDATLVLRYALVLALALALFTRLMGKVHERFPPRSTYTLDIAPRAAGLAGEDEGGEERNEASAGSWLRRVTSAGDLGRSRLLGGGKRAETPRDKKESVVMIMIARFNEAIVPAASVAATTGKAGGGGGLANGGSGVSGSSGGGLHSHTPSAHPSPGASTGAGSCAGSPSVNSGASDGSLPATLDLLVDKLLDAIMGSLQDGSSVFGPLMILAVKNDEGNLRKARKALDKYAETTSETKESVTLRRLLESEKASGIHKPGAVLMDPSAAIALLWMRRTLQFLIRCMQGVLTERPMGEVGVEAYQLELEPFHNWLLKSTFAMALNGFPNREEIINRLGAHLPIEQRDSMLKHEVEQCLEMLHQVVHTMRSLFEELGLEDMRKV